MANKVLHTITVRKEHKKILKELCNDGLIESMYSDLKYLDNDYKEKFIDKNIGFPIELETDFEENEKIFKYHFSSKWRPFEKKFLKRLNFYLPEFEYYWIEVQNFYGERVAYKEFQDFLIESFSSKVVNNELQTVYYNSFGELLKTKPTFGDAITSEEELPF